MIKKKEKPDISLNWPKNYYMEFDPAKRLALLELQVPDEADNLLRKELYNLRYVKDKHGKIIDEFTRTWLLMKIDTNTSVNFLNKARIKKQWCNYAHSMGLDFYSSKSEAEKTMFRQEWNAFFMQFIHNCCVDKTYGSTFFGVIPLTKEAISSKVALELSLLTCEYPAALGLADLYQPLYEIATEVYQNSTEV